MLDVKRLTTEFEQRYGAKPRMFRAPGRVNLIGEHTDYNDGFVYPCAIDFATNVACLPRQDRRITARTLNLDRSFSFGLDDAIDESVPQWAKYVQGVALILERNGHRLKGADLMIDSDVPIGAGLSSSAALEISTAFALATVSGVRIDGIEIAYIGQSAEHEFAGVRSGIMDQFASVFGRRGHGIFLDCRSMEWKPIPVSNAKWVICNTKKKHDLAESEYNKRRSQCEEAAALLGKSSLRDVTAAELGSRSETLPPLLLKRARHVVSENNRVLSAVNVLENGSLVEFGKLMNRSHESLRDDYEVSSPELDTMVELARSMPGLLGARMTGGGFGGSTVNLVEAGRELEFAESIFTAYSDATGITPEIYHCEASDGMAEIDM